MSRFPEHADPTLSFRSGGASRRFRAESPHFANPAHRVADRHTRSFSRDTPFATVRPDPSLRLVRVMGTTRLTAASTTARTRRLSRHWRSQPQTAASQPAAAGRQGRRKQKIPANLSACRPRLASGADPALLALIGH
jgi:hypothetical protein